MIHRAVLQQLIAEAIDFTLDAHGLYAGRVVQDCADTATESVMQRLAEEPGLTAILIWDALDPIGIAVESAQAEPQADPSDCVRSTEAVPARPEDALPLFTSAIYTPTEEERAPHLPEVKHYHGEIAPITGPLTGAASALSTEAPCDCNDGAPHYPCDHEVRSQFTPLNPEGRP